MTTDIQIDDAILEKINIWLQDSYDTETKKIIHKLLEEKAYSELTDAFYKGLEFGTGGLRGIMGPGSNRINKYTIGTTTQGFSNYLKKKYPNEVIQVAIAYDSRNSSDFFADIAANVFSANGIIVHLFKRLRPTPELSFAVRQLSCHGGVMITASHNPKEYNGYKVYGADGGQLLSPDDQLVIQEVSRIKHIEEVNFNRITKNIHLIDEEIDKLYLESIAKLSIAKQAIDRQKDLKIVYSPIHGTGITLVPQALHYFGFENIILVEEQIEPNGDFPTVIYPNPEEKEALTLALIKAKSVDADLVLATDPDADRVGIAIKDDRGEFIMLNGNQTASLLSHYLLTVWEKEGKLTGNEYIVKTIVTTPLIDEIARSKKVDCYTTLTGFKYIGSLITALEGQKTFIGGGEESYGYLIGELVRDKDAVISCAFIAEMTAFYKDQGISLYEAMLNMYQQYGLYQEGLISITKKGKTGTEKIKGMMQHFRAHTPSRLGGSPIVQLKDYEMGKNIDMLTGTISKLEFPKSDVLQFFTEDGSVVSARPSGTEPKIKFYCSVKAPLIDKFNFNQTIEILNTKITAIIAELDIQP